MSKQIFIVRHGSRIDFEDKSWAKKAQRPFDPPLSDLGLRQARETGTFLAQNDILAVYASPFLRTMQTATAIAEVLDLPVRVEGGLAEWLNPQWFSFEAWYASPGVLKEKFPRVDLTYEPLVIPRYPEITQDTCHARSGYVAQHLAAEVDGNVVLVGHGATVHGTLQGLTGSVQGMSTHLCAVNVVRRNGRDWELRQAGTDHLSSSEAKVRFN